MRFPGSHLAASPCSGSPNCTGLGPFVWNSHPWAESSFQYDSMSSRGQMNRSKNIYSHFSKVLSFSECLTVKRDAKDPRSGNQGASKGQPPTQSLLGVHYITFCFESIMMPEPDWWCDRSTCQQINANHIGTDSIPVYWHLVVPWPTIGWTGWHTGSGGLLRPGSVLQDCMYFMTRGCSQRAIQRNSCFLKLVAFQRGRSAELLLQEASLRFGCRPSDLKSAHNCCTRNWTCLASLSEHMMHDSVVFASESKHGIFSSTQNVVFFPQPKILRACGFQCFRIKSMKLPNTFGQFDSSLFCTLLRIPRRSTRRIMTFVASHRLRREKKTHASKWRLAFEVWWLWCLYGALLDMVISLISIWHLSGSRIAPVVTSFRSASSEKMLQMPVPGSVDLSGRCWCSYLFD